MSNCDDYGDGCCFDPEDFLESYEVKIREIMNEAVNVKIKSQLEELEQLKIDFKKVQEDYYKTRRELSEVNRQHELKMKQVVKDTEFEAQRKLGLDFAVGDTAYFVKNNSTSKKCDKCNNGKVDIEVLGVKTTATCPFCTYGRIHTSNYQPQSGVINSIKFCISKADGPRKLPGVVHDQNTEYYLGRLDRAFRRSNIYKTLVECQAVCDAENVAAEERALKKANGEE